MSAYPRIPIPASLKPTTPTAPHTVMFARVDDPEHNRLRRMITRDFTSGAASDRPKIQEMATTSTK